MRPSSTRLFPLALVLALALLSVWLERIVREEEGVHPSLRRHDPDYLVENLSIAAYDKAGRVESTLAAAKMVHYPDDDSTELVAPRVEQNKSNEPRITVTAERGALSQNGEEVFLYGNVLLVREAGADQPETRMRTTFLHVVRARSLVRTDREVVITQGARVLSGRGMEYHNETRQLTLHADVRGRFDPRVKP